MPSANNLTYDQVYPKGATRPIFLQDALYGGGFVTPEIFVDPSDPDDTNALAKAKAYAVANNLTLALGNSDTYTITTGLTYTDEHVKIKAIFPCKIIINGNTSFVDATANYTQVQSVSAYSHVAFNFGAGNTTVLQATVSNGAAYAVNNLTKIITDDLLTGPDPADTERWGERFKVGNISGNNLTMYSAIQEPVTGFAPTLASMLIGKMNESLVFDISGNITYELGPSFATSWNKSVIKARGFVKPRIETQSCNSTSAIFIEFIDCHEAIDSLTRASNCRTSTSDNAYGYGTIFNSCTNSYSINPFGDNCRHVWTTGCRDSVAGDNDFFDRGRTIDCHAIDVGGVHCQAAVADTHPDAYRCSFSLKGGNSGHNGNAGNVVAATIRGIANTAYCGNYTGNYGIQCVMDYADPWNSRDHVIYSPRYRTNNNISSDVREGIVLQGEDATNTVSGITIYDYIFDYRNGTSSIILMKYADAVLVNPVGKYATSSNAAELIGLDDNARLTILGGYVDLSGQTGTNYDIAKVRTATSYLEWVDPTFYIGSASIRSFVNFNSVAGTAIFRNVKYDTNVTTASGAVNTGGGPTFYLERSNYNAVLTGSATYNPPSLADGAGATTTVTVTGAALGDYVEGVAFSLDLQGITVTAYVSAADKVSVRFQNESGGLLDLASGTIYVRVRRRM